MTAISDEDIYLTRQARKNLLFNEGMSWVKKEGKKHSMFQWIALIAKRYVN